MARPPKIGGYIFRQAINRATRANTAARQAVKQILEANDPGVRAIILTKLTLALGENQDAIQEIAQIARNQPPPTTTDGDE